jgi:hypothetical protein
MNTARWRSRDDTRHSGVARVSRRTGPDSSSSYAAPVPGVASEARFLSEIVAAHADVRAGIDAAFPAVLPRGPDLVTLRGELRRRLDQLLDALLAMSGERDAMDALVPFVFFVDEQVEHTLALTTAPGASSWPQLQRDLFPEGRAEGGDVFYERASELLAEPTPRATVIAVYLFCLKAGFRGRLADEPEDVVDGWMRALAERLPSGAQPGEGRAAGWRPPRRSATYVVVALGAIAIWHLLVSAWAYLR